MPHIQHMQMSELIRLGASPDNTSGVQLPETRKQHMKLINKSSNLSQNQCINRLRTEGGRERVGTEWVESLRATVLRRVGGRRADTFSFLLQLVLDPPHDATQRAENHIKQGQRAQRVITRRMNHLLDDSQHLEQNAELRMEYCTTTKIKLDFFGIIANHDAHLDLHTLI